MTLRLRLALTTLLVGLPVLIGFWVVQYYFEERLDKESISQFVLAYMQSGGREECEANPALWNGGKLGRMPSMSDNHPPEMPMNQDDPADPWNRDPGGGPPGDMPPNRDDRNPPPHKMDGIYAYNAGYQSSNKDAPSLATELTEQIEAGDSVAQRLIEDKRMQCRPPNCRQIFFRPHPPNGPKKPMLREVLIRMPWNEGPCARILVRRPAPPFIHRAGRIIPTTQIWLLPFFAVLAALLFSIGPVVKRIRLLTLEVREFAKGQYKPTVTVKGKDEIGELARAFKVAGEEIRTQIAKQELRERTLRNFLENTTHDVMIPLTVLQGHLSDMMERTHGAEEMDADLVSSAMNEAQYISSLIENLLIAAKIEEGEPSLHWTQVNMNSLIERVIGRHQPIARPKLVTLEYAVPEIPLIVDGDITFIEQAVNNIVYNAINHNLPQGHVAVVLEPEGADDFILRVIDDGPGIAEEELSRLVDRWFRGNAARSRGTKGQGLGLSIAYQLAKLHHWSFELSRSSFGGLQVELAGKRISNEDHSSNSE